MTGMSRQGTDVRARTIAFVFVVVAAFLTAMIGAAGASAFSFAPAKTIGKAGDSRGFPRAAVDQAGVRTVVWHNFERRDGRIQAVRIGADGTIGSVKTLSVSNQDSSNPEVGVDESGRATIAWEARKGGESIVQWTRLETDGSQGTVETLPGEGADVDVAVNGDGAAVVAWTRYTETNTNLVAATVQPDGTLGPVATLDTSANTTGDEYKMLEIDGFGRGTVLWEDYRRNPTVYVARIDSSGIISQPRALSNPGRPAYLGSVDTHESGLGIALWTIRSGEIKMTRLFPDGTVGPVRTLSGKGFNSPFVAIDDQRRATAVWGVAGKKLKWLRIGADGKRGKTRVRKGASVNDIAMDGQGRVWVVWNKTTFRKGDGYRGSIKALRISRNGSVSAVRTLSGANENTYDFQGGIVPEVATSASGTAAVVWTDASVRNGRIRWSSSSS
jgi:hypothetical protein